ncbi:MAG: hypothetical protein ACN4GZ_16230 [Acidimicrobiales bacterium]
MRFRHPSKEQLSEWLIGAPADDPKLEEHIDGCDRCSSVIEALGEATASEPLVFALAQVLAAPPDLPDRLEAQVSQRLSGRELVGLMAEMFGAGVETSRLLIVDPPPPQGTS